MYLHALASHVPENAYTQAECWEIISRSGVFDRVTLRSKALLKRLLNGDNGIDKRHFAIDDVDCLFDRKPDELNRDFETSAPELARKALVRALERAGLNATELDALIICTCTGYLCPGVTSHVAEQMGLRSDCFLQDLVGLGCGAAIPTLRSAAGVAAMQPDSKIAVIAVEVCSAAFYIDDDPGVLVSLSLFGDGASASIWSGKAPSGRAPLRAGSFDTVHIPENRELLRFGNRDGYLRNQLDISVPEHAAKAVHTLFDRHDSPAHIVSHGGGRDVVQALRQSLPEHDFNEAESVLRDYGNLSSPAVLIALERYLDETPAPEQALWLTSFGAGFAAHSMTLEPSEG